MLLIGGCNYRALYDANKDSLRSPGLNIVEFDTYFARNFHDGDVIERAGACVRSQNDPDALGALSLE
jgi:hypothetical protein